MNFTAFYFQYYLYVVLKRDLYIVIRNDRHIRLFPLIFLRPISGSSSIAVATDIMKNYGVDSPGKSKEIQNRIKTTMLSRYGVASGLSLKSSIEKSHTKEVIDKINESKRKNHTFNTSKFEEEMFYYIKEKFPSVKRQYKDNIRYPWRCDFYIPELDYFIEVQGYYTHGKEPYNPNSIKHQVLVQRYKERYGTNCQPVTIWIIKDVEKRECAKKNNLNFKEIWTLEEGKKFIDFLYEMYK